MLRIWLLLMLIAFSVTANAQSSQIIKGIITDKASEKPLSGATIQLAGSNIVAQSDKEGKYVLAEVPLGRQSIIISFTGYKPATLPELLVTAGKEVILDIALEQNIGAMQGVTVTAARTKKGAAQNEYAAASSRSFNIEEVTRFSGGRNDPSKLVSNFAGVVSNNDSRNDIVVRGNSPAGVLWRIEGIPSPNPSHYATPGTTGGPVTALNTNALKTSDFLTSAFPAEFGNATAAVFDINFRTGNSDKHERTLQLNAFSGLEAMAEGPLSKSKNGSSYLLGYRYSFAQIARTIGLNIGTGATPKYQDWVFNFSTAKGKAGRLNFFGMGGISNIDFIGKDLDSADFYSRQDQDAYNKNYIIHFGLKHTIDINPKSYIRTVVTYSDLKNDFDAYQYERPVPPYSKRWQVTSSRNNTQTLRFSSFVNTKVNAKLNWRAGITGEASHFETKVLDREGKDENAPYLVYRDFDDNFLLLQYFAQAKYRTSDKFTITAGLHGMYFTFNKTSIIEPRASFSYQINNTNSIYLGYGLHGQQQPLPVYLFQRAATGGIDQTNRNLDFTKAHHLVLGYEKRFMKDWRVKAEVYYQRLFDVPVERALTGFSMLNAGNDFTFPDKAGLVNSGTGDNIGLELTIEKFLSKGWYVLATTSVFDSKYKGSDGIERNTSFNYGYVFNMLSGKEWKAGKAKRNAFTFDMRLSTVGGRYATPVNLPASIAAGKEILDETRYNEERLAGYFRLDAKIGFRMNSKKRKLSQTFYLDFQNVTNRENVFLQRYNADRGTIGSVNQLGFFPDIMYKVQF
jgi:ethanolamine utilization microcompartment shell protein EutS